MGEVVPGAHSALSGLGSCLFGLPRALPWAIPFSPFGADRTDQTDQTDRTDRTDQTDQTDRTDRD
jgi:hypothetical protein